MALIDTNKSITEIKAERDEFRKQFIKQIPIGTTVVNSNLFNDEQDGSQVWAKTAEGGIYDESEDSNMVNVTNINGIPNNNGVWTATFCKKA